MNGRPPAPRRGTSLRLVVRLKSGIKSIEWIEWIGAIQFTDRRPADYWAEQGYDWYAGH